MPILSTTERRIACGLPVGILLLALVVFVHNGFIDSPSNRLKCWTPQEFPPSWVEYTNAFCSSSTQVRDINRQRRLLDHFTAALTTPLFLLLIALLLMVPVAIGQLLLGVLKLTRDAKNERAWLSVLLLLLARALLLIFSVTALCLVVGFLEEKLNLLASREATALLTVSGRAKLLRSIENTFRCDLSIRRAGSTMSYTFSCALAQRTPLILAELSVLATWIALIFYVTWAAIGFVLNALLVISPTVRRNAAKDGAAEPREEAAMPMDRKEVAL